MRLKHLVLGAAVAGVACGLIAPTDAIAQGGTFVPIFSYRTGPFANSGIPNAVSYTHLTLPTTPYV